MIVTLDSDFHALLALSNARKPSVIRIRREGLGGPEVAKLLDQIWSKCKDAIQQGAMVTVTENKIRVRYLPKPFEACVLLLAPYRLIPQAQIKLVSRQQ